MLTAVGWVVRAICRGSDRLFVKSRPLVESVAALGPRDRIRYRPNRGERALDLLVSERDGPPFRFEPDCFNVVFAGNIGAAQSVETIV